MWLKFKQNIGESEKVGWDNIEKVQNDMLISVVFITQDKKG